MHAVALTWPQATLVGAALLGASGLVRAEPRLARVGPLLREAGYVAGLYALWQLVGSLATATAGASSRAEWIVRTERAWGLPDELGVQHLIGPHPMLAQLCNLYYATMHFTTLFALLIWLFFWHRGAYGRARTTVALVTGACLLVQFVPVAPPRLLPQLGFVDVAQQYGQSVYSGVGIDADQLSAMPSVHVAWAFLVAGTVVAVGTSAWRWIVLFHPVITVFVVVATANHFWLDGIVAVGLLAVVGGFQAAVRGRLTTFDPSRRFPRVRAAAELPERAAPTVSRTGAGTPG